MSRSKLVTSAKVVCYINGKPYAHVSSFRWSSTTARKAIYGLDQAEPYEFAAGQTRCTGNLSLWRQSDDGGPESVGLVAAFGDIPREKYFSLALVDITTDLTLFRADQCSVQDQSWDVQPKGLMTGSVAFEALTWSNSFTGGNLP